MFRIVWLLVVLACSSAVSAKSKVPEPPSPELPQLSDGRFGYEKVVTINCATAAELQSRARAWVAAEYNSSKAVTQLDDPAGATIVVKGEFSVPAFLSKIRIGHTITLQFKDGRYRVTLSGFTVASETEPPPYRTMEAWVDGTGLMSIPKTFASRVKGDTAVRCEAILGSLQHGMETPTPAGSAW
jgi:hypothetical protein